MTHRDYMSGCDIAIAEYERRRSEGAGIVGLLGKSKLVH